MTEKWMSLLLFSKCCTQYSVIVKRGSEDRLWWVSSIRGLFKVKSFFSSLVGFEGSCFPLKSVWRT
jgi:hypothetical protein